MGRKKKRKRSYKMLELHEKQDLVLDFYYRVDEKDRDLKKREHPLYNKLNFSDYRVREEVAHLTDELLMMGYLEKKRDKANDNNPYTFRFNSISTSGDIWYAYIAPCALGISLLENGGFTQAYKQMKKEEQARQELHEGEEGEQ